MGWFSRKPKKAHPYLSDTNDWRFESVLKHDLNLAIATFAQPQIFEMVRDSYVARPLGDWTARGLVHFDYDGPLIPFEMSVGSVQVDDDALGHFHFERIQPYNSPDYPEEHKGSYLRLGIHICDRGGICTNLEKAMNDAAISGKNFLHIRLGKPVVDIDVTRKEIAENNYSSSSPITKVVLTDEIRLKSPRTALAWDNL